MSGRARLARWGLIALGVTAFLVALIVVVASLLFLKLRGVTNVPLPEAPLSG